MTGPAPFTTVRSVTFSVLTVLLGVAAHRAGHGALPAVPDVVAAFVVSVVATRTLARRERGLPGLGIGVLASQVGLHVAFLGHHVHGSGLLPGRAMVLAHVLAGAVLVVWMRWGEQALGALARGVSARLAPARPHVLVVRPAWAVLSPLTPPGRPHSLVLAPTGRRGPPVRVVPLALA